MKISAGRVVNVVHRAGLCAFILVAAVILVRADPGVFPWLELLRLLGGMFVWLGVCMAIRTIVVFFDGDGE